MTGLRPFLEELPEEDLKRVKREVSPASYDVTGLLQNLENDGRFPAILFENPTDIEGRESEFQLVSNLFADRRRIARALDLPASDWRMETSMEYARREDDTHEPTVIPRDEAPVSAAEVPDLTYLPAVRHHRLDPAPYINMTPIMKDPYSESYNVAFLRNMVKGPKELGIHMSPRHNYRIFKDHEEQDENTPVAIAIGHHPAFYLGALTLAGFEADEYEIIGGTLGEPLRLTPSVTWGDDFLVPADAEVIVEGEVLANERGVEAPFGEFPGYYGPQRLRPEIKVTAITRRENPIFQHAFVGHPDNWNLGAVPKEGGVYRDISGRVPGVSQVCLPLSGCGRFRCYVSIDQDSEGEAKHAGLQALASSDFIKQVVIVDDDIDVFEEREVMWAIATRVRPETDISVIENVKGNTLDPSVVGEVATSKVLVDATIPVDEQYPPRVDVPEEAVERMQPSEYLE